MTVLFCLAVLYGTSSLPARPNVAPAVHLYEHGEFKRAAELLGEQCLSAPEAALPRLWLGRSYAKLHRWDDAIREFEKAVQIEPSNSLFHLWLGRAHGMKAEHSPRLLALTAAKKVLKEFEIAVNLSPDDTEARFDLLEYYLDAPGILGGGKDKARLQAQEIARLDPRLGYVARSLLFEKDKKWDQARQELVDATIEFPKVSGPWVDLADFLLRRSDFSGAALNARKALELAADRKARLILAASQVRMQKDLPEAERALLSMSSGPLKDSDPTFEDVHYWLGQACLAQGKKAEARQAFETALRFDPSHSRAKSAISQIH